jgi:hypothetical protein
MVDAARARTETGSSTLNTNLTSDLFETVSDLCERHDLTKAEFTERAFLLFAETLKRGKGNGVARD